MRELANRWTSTGNIEFVFAEKFLATKKVFVEMWSLFHVSCFSIWHEKFSPVYFGKATTETSICLSR